ncbi:type 1 glutamine amidotransferase [Candidatus Bathyarchaeota archaeon]|nr:type 1 glutamine amidotransferase [Candidatus Bathyarchaeota archaeon]
MPKALILIEEGFEDSEFVYPYYRFQEEGYKVDIVGPKAKQVYIGKHGVPITSDLSPEQVKIEEYDAVVVPGGRAPDRMRINIGLVKIVKEAYEKGKVIGAVCHGPQMLIEADILRGKKVTGWKSVATDLRNAGATFIDAEAVVDGKIVTSRSPADLPQFCREMLRLLGK